MNDKMKYRCSFCGFETDKLSMGCIRIGCVKCGKRGFEINDKQDYDGLMQMLGD